jgi:hypothetical protein
VLVVSIPTAPTNLLAYQHVKRLLVFHSQLLFQLKGWRTANLLLRPRGANAAASSKAWYPRRMGRHDCSVCLSPVASAVNAELLKPRHERMKLRELEKLSGLSRSALGRHSLNCIPKLRLALNREKKVHASGTGRMVVFWPQHGDTPSRFSDGDRIVREDELRDDDLVLAVSYESTPLHEFKNPIALVTPELVAEAEAEDAARSKAHALPN